MLKLGPCDPTGSPQFLDNQFMVQTDEATQIGEVMARVLANYPDCSTGDIARVVQTLHAGFDGAKIREFVPLLVERAARDVLAHQRTGARTPATGERR